MRRSGSQDHVDLINGRQSDHTKLIGAWPLTVAVPIPNFGIERTHLGDEWFDVRVGSRAEVNSDSESGTPELQFARPKHRWKHF